MFFFYGGSKFIFRRGNLLFFSTAAIINLHCRLTNVVNLLSYATTFISPSPVKLPLCYFFSLSTTTTYLLPSTSSTTIHRFSTIFNYHSLFFSAIFNYHSPFFQSSSTTFIVFFFNHLQPSILLFYRLRKPHLPINYFLSSTITTINLRLIFISIPSLPLLTLIYRTTIHHCHLFNFSLPPLLP